MIRRSFFILFAAFLLVSCQSSDQNTTDPTSDDKAGIDLVEITIADIQAGYDAGTFTVTDVIEAYIDRIDKIDRDGPQLNSVLLINPDALGIAKQLDKELASGKKRGPMHGIPVLLKDNIDTHDQMPCTAGARPMEGSMPKKDSFIAARLRKAGAVILGKANLSEWANFHSNISSSGWSALGGQVRNPYDVTRNPCGSSAGSGVSVSANLTAVAIGTETNGSIVCPSTANGIVGIKPTVGLLSRSGIIPISHTQDTPGPTARTVRDAAICLSVMTGVDSTDDKTLASPDHIHPDYTAFLKADGLKGKRIGLNKATLGGNWRVDSLVYQTVRFLEAQGAEVIELDAVYNTSVGRESFDVLLYEFKDGLNKYLSALGPDAKVKSLEDLIEKTKADSVEMQYHDHALLQMAQDKDSLGAQDYKDALAKMLKASREDGIDRVMDEHKLDAIIGPTGSPAWKTDWTLGDHFVLASSSPAARAGYPNITVPMGFIDGLPVGMSFFGRAWSEPVLLEITYGFEQASQVRKAPEYKECK